MYWGAYSLFIIAFISCNKPSDSIVGKYDLLIIESQNENGIWQQADWMRNSTGRLGYLANDTVTVHFTPENYGEKGVEAYWYIATYKKDSDSNYVEHTRVRHSNPKEVGKTVKRYFELHNDTLVMHAKEFGFRLKWLKRNE